MRYGAPTRVAPEHSRTYQGIKQGKYNNGLAPLITHQLEATFVFNHLLDSDNVQ